MKPELLELLKDLADVLEKHSGGICYYTTGQGIVVSFGQHYDDEVCIGFPENGDVSKLRAIIQANQPCN